MSAISRLKIVFMGTPAFAVHILKGLLEQECDVVGVITAPDKPAGRGQKIKQSEVKQFALTKGLNILQPNNLKSPDFVAQLKALKPDLQVVVAFRMLPKEVWQLPKHGTFNLHASLLPNYRGAAPINWAIIYGEKETGVTTFFIDDNIDTGAIILQSKVDIDPKDTAGTLHDKLMHSGSHLVNETIDLIAHNKVQSTFQSSSKLLKSAHKLNKENCRIHWNKSGQEIYNLVRGLNPYPGAWGLLRNGEECYNVKIYNVDFKVQHHNLPCGKILADKSKIDVVVKNGFISILEFKFPGKKQMDSKSFLNGFEFETNAKMI